MKKLSLKERTLQSIKDGFGGDPYRRIEYLLEHTNVIANGFV